MNDDPMEGTSELFASILSDVTPEQWEIYKSQQNELGMYIVDDGSEGDSEYSDSEEEEFTTNVEIIQQDDELARETESDDDTTNSQTYWGCDAAFKYVNGEISFSELNDIMQDDQPKPQRRRKQAVPKEDKEPREETQLEKEDREYQAELKNKRKRTRRRIYNLPKEYEGLMGAANLNFAKGNTQDAIKMCMELIRLAPTAQEPFQTLGVIYEEMGELKKSFQCYLVAAYLNPSDTEEWVRLAEISVEQNQLHQAISCYSHAIRNEPTNLNFLWERCNLYEQVGERKRALKGYEMILKQLSNPEDGVKCVETSREIAKVHHGNNDFINAIRVLENAFSKFPSLLTSEDVNFLLELQLVEKFHKDAVKNFVQHCGVTLKLPDRVVASHDEVMNLKEEEYAAIENCYVPEVLPIDLWAKMLICCIYLKAMNAVKPLLESLKKEDPLDIGDIYLDVAEGLMETGHYALAEELLLKLLETPKYNLPAVWMKYGDCLIALSNNEDAVKAYENVIKMAPSYQDARLALSKIYLTQGKVEEATSVLRQDYEEGKEVVLGIDALYERCKLLETEERWEEYISTATLLQYSHCYVLETEEEYNAVLANQTSKRRNEALRDLKAQHKKVVPEFVGKSVPVAEMYTIYKTASNKLMELKRFGELMTLSLSGLTSTMFMKNPEMAKEVEFQALLSCFFSGNYYYAYLLVKDLVLKNIQNPAAWNLFSLIVTYSQENRHNRFCLRLMMKHQDNLALGYLNGHNAMISGTYKHALGEYMCILKDNPNDSFITFCVGIAFIHMACQKFATKRHFLMIQALAFLYQYLKLKGECQETYYNIGRGLHQLGIKDAALYHYQKALDAPLRIKGPDQETFDLRREIAYNISLIYQSTGAMDLAYMYMREHIVV